MLIFNSFFNDYDTSYCNFKKEFYSRCTPKIKIYLIVNIFYKLFLSNILFGEMDTGRNRKSECGYRELNPDYELGKLMS